MAEVKLTPAEEAHFLAATAVAHANAYFINQDVAELQQHATQMMTKLLMVSSDGRPRRAVDATRMLVVAMLRTALATDDARRDRWRSVLMALDGLVRHECRELEARPSELAAGAGAKP